VAIQEENAMAAIEARGMDNGESECSAPKLWRSYFSKIVGAFVKNITRYLFVL